jgi:hypothetical protein
MLLWERSLVLHLRLLEILGTRYRDLLDRVRGCHDGNCDCHRDKRDFVGTRTHFPVDLVCSNLGAPCSSGGLVSPVISPDAGSFSVVVSIAARGWYDRKWDLNAVGFSQR